MIYYASRTGNVRAILARLALPSEPIHADLQVNTPFLLFTYTDGLGQVPKTVEHFMRQAHPYCKGIIVSGNSNFGHDVFCAAGDKLRAQYNIPIVRKIELRGFHSDDEAITQYYKKVITGEKLPEAEQRAL